MVVKKEGNKCNYFNGDLEYFEGRNLEMEKIIFKNSEDLHVNTNTDICNFSYYHKLIYISFSFEFQLQLLKFCDSKP